MLLWRPAGRLVRFGVVVHPARGSYILMCTDTSLSAVDIIRLYGLRFKIECSFKQAVRQIGSFSYHFWMKDMIPLRYHDGNQYLHRKSADYRNRVKRKMRAYHAFIQAGVVAPGIAPVFRRRRTQACLEFLRVLAAHHSSWHPASTRPAPRLARVDEQENTVTARQPMEVFNTVLNRTFQALSGLAVAQLSTYCSNSFLICSI
jgi:hypothetical protein